MTSRRSSGSRRADRAVEPTRSENITVTCRRSAVSWRFYQLPDQREEAVVLRLRQRAGPRWSREACGGARQYLRRGPLGPPPSNLAEPCHRSHCHGKPPHTFQGQGFAAKFRHPWCPTLVLTARTTP